MSLLAVLLLGIGLSLDTFAVSLTLGLAAGRTTYRQKARFLAVIGLFHFAMILAGWFMGETVSRLIAAYDHWIAFGLLAFIGGLFIEKSKGQPVIAGIGLVLGDAACYVLGTAWFVFQMQCELGYALSVCVYPFIALDLAKIVVSCIVGALLRKRLVQAGVLKLKEA